MTGGQIVYQLMLECVLLYARVCMARVYMAGGGSIYGWRLDCTWLEARVFMAGGKSVYG